MTLRHGLEIRAAAAGEAPGLAALLAEAGHVIDARDLAERLAGLRQGAATALVAVQWGPPSGLLVMHWYPTLDAPSAVAQITLLLVGEEHRRHGIGRLLLKSAGQVARMAGCSRLEIATASDAPSLHAFCRATGFSEAGPRFVRALRKQA
ncbi:MAG: family N-acetyltransferase [Rubritepida sp.]|nr:family N-acetyltransferase [Rubritepida sp.]